MADTLGDIGRNSLTNLLPKNISVSDDVEKGGLTSLTQARGTFGQTLSGVEEVREQLSVDELGDEIVERLINRNKFIPPQDFTRINIEDLPAQKAEPDRTDYLEKFDFERDFLSFPTIIDILDNRQDVVSKTPLSQIGADRLEFSVFQNIGANFEQETTNRLLSTIDGGTVAVDRITTPSSIIGQAFNFLREVSGFETPVSILSNDAISWQEFRGRNGSYVTEEVAKTLLKNTSNFQKRELKRLLKKNDYIPKYGEDNTKDIYIGNKLNTQVDDNTDKLTTVGEENINFESQASVNPNTSISTESSSDVTNSPYGRFTDEELSTDNILWESGNFPFNNPNRILYKTQEIVNNTVNKVFIKTDTNSFKEPTELGGGTISRGSNIRNESGELSRVHTKRNRYNKLSRLIRSRGLDVLNNSNSNESQSVLGDNGMIRFAPYNNDLKRVMFSIENLAWADRFSDLPDCEKGAGDPSTGLRGRIMWFPPYDLSITDSNDGDWNSVNFIGRAEPIYTYIGSKRSASLRFKVLVDHPSRMNFLRGETDREEDIQRFIHGLGDLKEFTNKQLNRRISDKENDSLEVARNWLRKELVNGIGKPQSTKLNAQFKVNSTELVSPLSAFTAQIEALLVNNTVSAEIVAKSGGIQSDGVDAQTIQFLGFDLGQLTEKLAIERGNVIADYLETVSSDIGVSIKLDTDSINDNTYSEIKLISVTNANTANAQAEAIIPPIGGNVNISDQLTERLFENECAFFDELERENPFVFNKLTEKIKYFHPAFHSITPAGFNSRLNFLLQCVRQGPSIGRDGVDNVKNLAFGRPPVLILRLGDFYYTKCVADNVNITYTDNLWDLNPEGVGVQPMIAEVDMSLKIIGGSSLEGPINRLQNAVSFNYFANTGLYDNRADSIPKVAKVSADGSGSVTTKPIDGVTTKALLLPSQLPSLGDNDDLARIAAEGVDAAISIIPRG